MNLQPFFYLAGNFQYRRPTLVSYIKHVYNFFNLLSIVYSSAEFCFSQSLIVLLVFLGEILKMLSYKLQKKYYFKSSQKNWSQLTYEAILRSSSYGEVTAQRIKITLNSLLMCI